MLRAGQTTRIDVDQTDVDVAVRVGPSEQPGVEIDRSQGRGGRETVFLVADEDATYRLLLRPLGRIGVYALRPSAPREATDDDRRWVRASEALAAAERHAASERSEERDRADRLFSSAAADWRALDLLVEEAYTLRQQALALEERGRRWDAPPLLQRALQAARRARAPREEGRVLVALGYIQRRLGQIESAHASFQRAKILALGKGDPLLGDRVVADAVPEDVDRDLVRAARKGELWNGRDWLLLAAAWRRHSLLLTNTAGPDRAVEYSLAAVEVLRAEQRPDLLGDTLPMLCEAYTYLGRPREADAAVRCGLRIARQIGDKWGEVESYLQLGWQHYLARRHVEALDQYAKGLALAERIGWVDARAAFLDRRASALLGLGRVGTARVAYEASLKLWREHKDERFEAHTLANLGSVAARQGRWEEADRRFKEAIRLFKEGGEGDNQAHVMAQRAEAFLDHRSLDETLLEIDEALRLCEQLRRSLSRDQRAWFLAVRHQFYELKVEVLMRQKAAREAFEAAERGRARALADDLAADAGRLAPEALPLDAVRKLLDDDTLLLAYALGKRRSFLWLIGRDTFEVHELPPREEIEKHVRTWHDLLPLRQAAPGLHGTRDRSAGALGQLLLGPVEGRLGRKRLLIVRDELLQYVPFAALPAGAGGAGGPPRLIDDHEITCVPSALVLDRLRRRNASRPPAPRPAIVFADPVFQAGDKRFGGGVKGADLPMDLKFALEDVKLPVPRRLPWTSEEATAIARLAGPGATTVRDFEASLDRLAGAQARRGLHAYRYLHFATHGLLNARNPHLSGLLLSLYDRDGRPRDGFLRTRQVEDWALRADLVTLSACHSALGEELRGEGLLGLTPAFLKAGATRVVVSLWAVEERATAALMERFYEEHLKRGLRPAAALRQAQLALRDGPRPPIGPRS